MIKILIAEDDPTSRNFLFKTLSGYGKCDLAVDGFEALDAFLISVNENKPYDLLCIDIMMPKFDGLKVVKAIREMEDQSKLPQEKKAKVILTTALDKAHIAKNYYDSNYEAFIQKPINTNMLIETIKGMGLI